MEKLSKRWCLKARWEGLPLHHTSMLFPEMEWNDISELYADIEKNGQRVPVLMWNGLIVDGRHRAIVCDALGLPLKTEDISHMPETELPGLVFSLNAPRRHMSKDQMALVAALMSKESRRGGDQPTQLEKMASSIASKKAIETRIPPSTPSQGTAAQAVGVCSTSITLSGQRQLF